MSERNGDSDARYYAEVALPVHVYRTFTYTLPKVFQNIAEAGARVVVPVGRRLNTGYIVKLTERLPPGLDQGAIKEVRDLIDLVPVVSDEILTITKWVADYYAAPWGEVLRAALPPGITETIEQIITVTPKGLDSDQTRTLTGNKRVLLDLAIAEGEVNLRSASSQLGKAAATVAARELERQGFAAIRQEPSGKRVREKTRRAVRLIPGASNENLTEHQLRVVAFLGDRAATSLKDLLGGAGVSESVIRSLQRKGIVEVIDQTVRRDPLATMSVTAVEPLALTDAQGNALKEIEKPLRAGTFATFLLHGVTGSGKTEVYLRAMQTALELSGSALMLVPEIALTPVFSRRLRSQFGDQVAIFHSSLSKGERFDEWSRVRNGEARIVIGTRSAVFAPIKNLRLIVVDEEHEATYRQQESPYYHGRDTAVVRGQKEGAVVVLGSATPSLESFHNAHTRKYSYLRLAQRIGGRPLAAAQLIDMRDVFAKRKKPQVFSDELLAAIETTHARNEQSIILLNRRGYSSFVLCRSCGESIHCPNCDVTLTYHRGERVIVCHYCNHREGAPAHCPICSGKYIYYVGEGTEQIEELLRQRFPALRIARVDRDTISRRRTFEQALLDFSEGKLDMLVGTQMLAKGHDFPNVTLVGVVSVDAGLQLPDFRAAERTFQLITQVAGRAGRGDLPGQVLIQSYHPSHYALRHACAQDYLAFYEEEIKYREHHAYPPFVALASLLVHAEDPKRTQAAAAALRRELDGANKDRICRILGPAPAPIARLRGEHRIQLLVKTRQRKRMRQIIDTALAATLAQGHNPRSINVEIDPVSIM